jgi:hypothetical protein
MLTPMATCSSRGAADDPLATFQPPVTMQESTSPEEDDRWGDYAGVDEEPDNPGTFWTCNEYRTSSWRTWVGQVVMPDNPCPGDLDGDNQVGIADLAQLLGNYGMSGATQAEGDLDEDGDVDLADLAELLGNYGMSCP